MTRIIFAAVFAAAALSAPPAAAKDHSWPVGNDQYHVYYTDLDLNSAAGRADMLARVEKAATKLCAHLISIDRPDCVADTLRQTAVSPRGHFVALALAERGDVKFAAR